MTTAAYIPAYVHVIVMLHVAFALAFYFLDRRSPSRFARLFAISWAIEAVRAAIWLPGVNQLGGAPELWFAASDVLCFAANWCLLAGCADLVKARLPRWLAPAYFWSGIPVVLFNRFALPAVWQLTTGSPDERVRFYGLLANLVIMFVPVTAFRLAVLGWLERIWRQTRLPGAMIATIFCVPYAVVALAVPVQFYYSYSHDWVALVWCARVLGFSIGLVMLMLDLQQATVAKKEANLAAAQALAKVGSWELNPATGEATWSAEMFRLYHCDPQKGVISRERFLTLMHPADRERFLEEERLAIEQQRGTDHEFRILRADGTMRWVHGRKTPLFNATGKLVQLIGVEQDITERKRAEAELRESEGRYRSVIEGAPQAIILHRDGVIVFVNPAAIRLYGAAAAADLVGRRMLDLVHPLFHEEVLAWRRRIVDSGEEARHVHARHLKLDGSAIEVEVQANRVIYEGTPVVHLMVHDITERKRNEAALRDSEERYRRLFEAESDAIVLVNMRTNLIEDANGSALKLYGYTHEEFLRLHPTDMSAEPARTVDALKQHITAVPLRWHRRKDGSTFPVEINSSYFEVRGKQFSVAAIRDLTEIRRVEEEGRRLESKLRETQKLESLGVLAGGIAHDFNNLLTGILGHASLAACEVTADSPVQANLEAIKQGSVRAAELCKQMLAYAGRGRFEVKRIGLNRLVEETTQLLELSISKKSVLRFNLRPDLPAIEADETQTRQVIMNLVINASEAMQEKGGFIRVSTGLARVDRADPKSVPTTPELPDGTYISLEVADSGSGMSPETLQRIFDPFFTTKFAGRGLGLSAVLGIMRGHGGAVGVVSEPGRGTTFRLLFPIAAGPVDGMAAKTERPATKGFQGRILLVDDEESVRGTAALMLRKLGFEVATAADGNEAVNLFRSRPDGFGLVLMDLTMPRLDGAEACAALLRIRPQVRIVLMSGYDEREATARFPNKQLAGFLTKPFEYEQLTEVVHHALAS